MKKDLYLSFAVIVQLVIVTIQLLMPLSGFVTVEQAASFRVAITLFTFLPGIIIVLSSKPSFLIIPFVFFYLFLFLNYILFSSSHVYIESSAIYSLTPISILTIIFVASVKNIDAFFRMLLYISRIAPFVAFLYVLAFNISPFRDFEEQYSMSFGYSMLLPAMFLFRQDKYVDKFLSICLLLLILMGGSRGPAIVLALFYMLDTILFRPAKSRVGMLAFFLFILAFIIIILPHFIDFAESRTLSLLGSGDVLTHDGGRDDELYSVVKPHIMEKPFIGWGIGADRYFLDGAYCHNVFYEVYLHYGVIIGSLLFMIFFFWCFRTFFSKKIRRWSDGRVMFILMFLYGFVPLLVSNSYLISYNFAIMAGFMIWVKRNLKFIPV